jgi:enoyl-CoA hydratase/carnithine racemase
MPLGSVVSSGNSRGKRVRHSIREVNMTEHVRVQREGSVLTITLARPERRNAITVAMYAALAEAFESAANDPEVRVISIAGEGPDFAAGNDLADFLHAPPRDVTEIPVWRLLRALARCETPVIAAVHGNCVGIGTTMLLHCDLVVADPGTRFSLPFIDLALVPEAASTLLLPRLVGRRRAARYLLLGESFGTDEALDIGIVSHVAPDNGVGALALQLTARLLAKPPEALRQSQKLLREGTSDDVLERMELESGAFSERLQSAEVKQAIAAFFDSRSR